VSVDEHDYEQCAVIFDIGTEAPLAGRAFERFTKRGPIAMLPLTGGRAAVIWTLPAADARSVAELPDDRFREELQTAFGYRLGRITRVGARHMHALARIAAPRSSIAAARCSSATRRCACTRLPVKASTSLRAIATLAEVIADRLAEDGVGHQNRQRGGGVLERYRGGRGGSAARAAPHPRLEPVRRIGAGLGTPGLAHGVRLVPGARVLAPDDGPRRTAAAVARGLRLAMARVPRDSAHPPCLVAGAGTVGWPGGAARHRLRGPAARAGDRGAAAAALARRGHRFASRCAVARVAAAARGARRAARRRARARTGACTWEGTDVQAVALDFDAADIGEPDLGHIVEDNPLRTLLADVVTVAP
jgi:hypothetical protein